MHLLRSKSNVKKELMDAYVAYSFQYSFCLTLFMLRNLCLLNLTVAARCGVEELKRKPKRNYVKFGVQAQAGHSFFN